MKAPVIISFGEVLWDLFPEGSRFGGAPANFACHAAALGGEVTMVSAVGDDLLRADAIEILRQYEINTDLIQKKSGVPTGTVAVQLDTEGKPKYTINEGSAWDRLAWNPEIESRVKLADAVYFGTLGQRNDISRTTIRRALTAAAEVNIPCILDVNLRAPYYDDALIHDSVMRASILKLSDEELPEVCSAFDIPPTDPAEDCLARVLEKAQLDLVVMTCGAKGAILVSSEQSISEPGIPITVRDTVGAGDAFTAAFLIGHLRGDTHETILTNANELAANVCSQSGAVPSFAESL